MGKYINSSYFENIKISLNFTPKTTWKYVWPVAFVDPPVGDKDAEEGAAEAEQGDQHGLAAAHALMRQV